VAVSSSWSGMNENTPPPEATDLQLETRHQSDYKIRRVPIAPGIQLHFSVRPQQPTVHTDSPLVLKMPKDRNSTVRHSGPSLSPYRKPSIQARTTDDAEVLEQLTALQRLASKLATKRRIVIISGAGTSTNAGSKSQEVDVSCSNQIP
jgi:hypothetical protein